MKDRDPICSESVCVDTGAYNWVLENEQRAMAGTTDGIMI